ncbi:DUF2059 domain-containing protein [Marispirochaeta aestuarii]|uniref:DUF2059 domain-containing protein n=1 Tax=Marispirochaeta aestuarii TaxID=1963862 RepID=UPI0029C75701|nr:DUF2059 domain-containing protein [Marispirochaeta aestuarii]
MKKSIVILLFSLLSFASLFGQSKEDDIVRLMEMTGSADMGIQVMQNMIVQFKQILPEVPEDYWDQFMARVNPEDMIDLIVPIYDKHFTHEEITDIISFYETPTGKKLIQEMPAISQESMSAGQAWGMRIGQEIQQQLVEDGLLDI